MTSENRLKRKILQRNTRDDDNLVKDNEKSSEESPLFDLVKYGLIAFGGYKLYKAGAFKDISKGLLEVANRIAKEGDIAATSMSTIKQWSKLKRLTTVELANSNQKFNVPQHSLFRDRDSSIFYDFAQDVKDIATKQGGLAKFARVRTAVQETGEDIGNLLSMIDDNVQNLPKKRTNYFNTKLSLYMKEVQSVESIGGEFFPGDAKTFNPEFMKQFMQDMTITAEKRSAQLKETGYRHLVLEDLIEQYTDQNGLLQWRMKSDAPIDIFDNGSKDSLGEKLFSFFNNPEHWQRDSRGIRQSILKTEEWKNIIVDPSMKIGEAGGFIDFRTTSENIAGFANSLIRDFKLPLVQFNPIRSALGTIGIDNPGAKVPHMGFLSPDQIDPNITHKAGRVTIGEYLAEQFGDSYAKKSVAVIGGKGYIVTDNRQLLKIADGLKLHDITKASDIEFLEPMVNAMRQMAGLTLGEPEKYAPVMKDAIQKYEAKLGRQLTSMERAKFQTALFLDIGFQEYRPKGMPQAEGFDSATSIDEIINHFIDKQTKKIRVNGFEYKDVEEMLKASQQYDYSSVFGKGFSTFTSRDKVIKPRKYVTTKKGFTLSKAFQEHQAGNIDKSMYELKGFFAQYASGRKADGTMGEFFTERTGRSWSILNNLNDQLADNIYFLGFSNESKRNVPTYLKNFLLKRALPVYMLTKVPELINYFSEPLFGYDDGSGTDNRDNITKFMTRNVVKPIDITAHRAMDLVGATTLFKFLGDMVPGSDQINELPGIYHMGLGQTKEEREEYIEKGMDPVRKGRYWGSGNTPLTGDKIMYWRPNLYRRIQADVDFSDSKWGSRQEYYENTWFPNPAAPFAPLNHFLFDRNHYDKKHYYDRPYLRTAPEGSNIPLIGPLFGATIGTVINPPQKMHKEYWKDLRVNPADEAPSPLITEGTLQKSRMFYKQRGPEDYHVFNEIEQKAARQKAKYSSDLLAASYQARVVTSRRITDNSGVQFTERVITPVNYQPTGDISHPFEVYTTPSGSMKIVDIPETLDLQKVNWDLRQYSINKIQGTNQRVTINDINAPDIPKGNDSPDIDNAFMYGLGEQYNLAGEVAGLRGFMFQQFITGKANQDAVKIEDSGYAYSINRDFWEENLGGLGANLSEITRRFIPNRNKNTTYVNPIRNTMPSWMPGSNYFTDFKHGDSFVKIDNGEERLPGQGYERLYGIDNLERLDLKISQLGQDESFIIKSMFPQTRQPGDDDYLKELGSKSNKIASHLKSLWKEKGVAFATDGYINDKRNHITGRYDAMVYDLSSPTGIGVVDIRAVSDKEFKKLSSSKRPKPQHQEQINYMLWATDNMQSKGYVHYVNRDNPEKTHTIGFNYNDRMLQRTLKEANNARKTVRTALDQGQIGRGELYGLMDRYRILADVAPYSQEFKDVQAQISMAKLSEADKEEAAQIRQRLKEQKEPFRVYPYKFKTSNLKTEQVTVKKVIDNNTFISWEYGDDHAIKFGGIRVTESSEPVEKKQYPRKRRKGITKIAHNIRKKLEEGPTQKERANTFIKGHLRKNSKVTIAYDADEHNKFKNDSTNSIRAIVHSRGRNVNQALVKRGYATVNEKDNSPTGIHMRYNKGEIAFGSAMETITHDVIGSIPLVGSKFMNVQSPYERYRDREVYGKDFQSWNHPIRDIFLPNMVDKPISNNKLGGVLSVVTGAFIGSLFGKNKFGKLIGGFIGGSIPAIGKAVFIAGSTKDRDWRPKRRREQENVNEYIDTLKYVKNMHLYAKYSEKARTEDHFDVQSYIEKNDVSGIYAKLRQKELNEYKKKVKLDFKNSKRFQFRYDAPKYQTKDMDSSQIIKAVNKELNELKSNRKVDKLPLNAIKAISFKQEAEKTMYGYNPGDSLVNLMSSLPKKDRQYFKYFMNAPEEEKDKILRVAPSYMRRALQGAWGLPVDRKPTLQEYFSNHALPNADWIGWDENTDMDAVKVKIVHKNKLDPGEFDIWKNNQKAADAVNIPIPVINAKNNPREVQIRLQKLFGNAQYDNVQVRYMNNARGENGTTIDVFQDMREEVENQMQELEWLEF